MCFVDGFRRCRPTALAGVCGPADSGSGKVAALTDRWFVLLSDSCLPVVSFARLHEALNERFGAAFNFGLCSRFPVFYQKRILLDAV